MVYSLELASAQVKETQNKAPFFTHNKSGDMNLRVLMCFKTKSTLEPSCHLPVAIPSLSKMAVQAPTFQVHIWTRGMVKDKEMCFI